MKTKTIAETMAEKLPKDVTLIEVTSSAVYMFPKGYIEQFESTEQFVEEWFKNHPLDKYHASRDVCKVGNTTTLIDVNVHKGILPTE
jgi:hypothetical protein